MKTIGLLGGMSWESTQSYYRLINEGVKAQLGGLSSAKIVLHSVNFADIEVLQRSGDWQGCGDILGQAARGLELAGAQCIVICTNTMHKVVDEIAKHTSLPIIHVADVVAESLKAQKIKTVSLLGTRFTMQELFYIERLREHGLSVIVPPEHEQHVVDNIIYQELCMGNINTHSKQQYLNVINALQVQGAQAVILGCTEIGLLISQSDCELPLLDTTQLHAQAAVKFALQ
ncbi:L-aspartate/glutamate-specific racemase [Pseudoalteromonas holothuriae]|uniref:L-aspartate/glutamate-specific racemase n=1 Tax=Pseudoalteromonas holothuriae TaxID=2963714 RepID=A0A9W4R4V9_9GAMM|nr:MULTISPECIES: aspartate/glutamate racemase family protein [unclassified Pseudoalteromonas]CAH9066973.1 L-aspartate/glutamate-specific racemase [Pseudoalteromonas sp. CIP111854]CAH9068143.1 L-aspartate/glutamate-specific racemase [Pseudoalteromonas sp. CIP111951]